MSGMKENPITARQEAVISNPFDALRFVDNDDVLGANGCSSIGADFVEGKGKANADVLNLVDLRNSFDALMEMDNVFVNVGTSTAEKVCNTVNGSIKVVDESESGKEDIYDETAQNDLWHCILGHPADQVLSVLSDGF
nr:hypothetical protein [Tanacetum cinerariifolium]